MRLFCFLFIMFFGFSGYAKTKNIAIDISTQSIDRSLISSQASDEAAKQFIQEFLGEKKYKESEKKIEKEIFPQKNRYILYVKIGKSIKQEDESYLTNVIVSFSEDNLQSLLVEHHLYYDSLATSCVLPAVIFTTKTDDKQSYQWWKDKTGLSGLTKNLTFGLYSEKADSKTNLPKVLAANFYHQLNRTLIENSFHAVDPVFNRLSSSIPQSALPRSNRSSQFIKLAKFLDCHIILSGNIEVVKSQNANKHVAEISLTSFNITTRQKLFDFKKVLDLENKNSKTKNEVKKIVKSFDSELENILNGIIFQLSFYKDKGSLNLYRTVLSIQGPLNYSEKERLKKYFIRNIPSIKDLQERLLSSSKVIYEAEISGSMSKVVRDLGKYGSKTFSWQVVGYNRKEINVYARKK